MSQQLWIRFILHSFTEIENKRKQFRWDQFHRSNSDFLFAIVRLPNEGNTCYINSMVQALLALADFTGGVAGLCRRRRRNGEAGGVATLLDAVAAARRSGRVRRVHVSLRWQILFGVLCFLDCISLDSVAGSNRILLITKDRGTHLIALCVKKNNPNPKNVSNAWLGWV